MQLVAGCEYAQYIAGFGKEVDVPYLLSANLGRLTGEWVFNLRIMAIGEARVVARAGTISSENNLANIVREETRKLLDFEAQKSTLGWQDDGGILLSAHPPYRLLV